MNFDNTIKDFQTDITPPAIVRKIKYDPTINSLNSFMEGINYFKGEAYPYSMPTLEQIIANSWTSSTDDEPSDSELLAAKYETSIIKHKKLWENLPAIEDYFELDALNNVEETEIAFYKASEKYGW